MLSLARNKVFNFQNIKHFSLIIKEIASTRKFDKSLELASKKSWEETLKKASKEGKVIWDSEIYRLESLETNKRHLNINLSTIPFSIRIGMNDHSELVKKLGINYAPLGVYTSCFILTSDKKYLFIKKSDRYYSNRKYSFVGGILSKTEKKLSSGKDLFGEMRKEIQEETGLRNINLNYMTLNAGYLSKNYNFCLIFSLKLTESLKTVLELFKYKSDGEAEEIVGVEKKDLHEFRTKNLTERDLPKFKIMNLN